MIDHQMLERLYSRRRYGIKPGLEVIRALLGRMNCDVTSGYPVVHVAGTNGKGSVCAIVESILREAGFKTGLYTSPHLVRLNERMKINGIEISDGKLVDLINDVERFAEGIEADAGREPTFFEMTTAMAFEYFKREHVDIAVIETGMGGRYDATNVVDPLVSVLTGVSVEHTEYLGKDIQSIAVEKCGIIKKGRPVVCGEVDEPVIGIVREAASRSGSILRKASEHVNIQLKSRSFDGQKIIVETAGASYGTINFPFPGDHQLANLAVAITAIELLMDCGFDFDGSKAVKKGVSNVVWPGRFQVLQKKPPVILDGAHNPEAAGVLALTLKQLAGGRPVGLVIGMCRDKDVQSYLKHMKPMARKMWAVPISDPRGFSAAELTVHGINAGLGAVESVLPDAVRESLIWAGGNDGIVCITGSLFLVGEILEKWNEFQT